MKFDPLMESRSALKSYRGIVRGKVVVLDQDIGLPEGTRVEVVLKGLPLPPCAADSNPMSSQRPMSPEEREELERVYQDRGCGTECDP